MLVRSCSQNNDKPDGIIRSLFEDHSKKEEIDGDQLIRYKNSGSIELHSSYIKQGELKDQ